jgi:hypothetical protein
MFRCADMHVIYLNYPIFHCSFLSLASVTKLFQDYVDYDNLVEPNRMKTG